MYLHKSCKHLRFPGNLRIRPRIFSPCCGRSAGVLAVLRAALGVVVAQKKPSRLPPSLQHGCSINPSMLPPTGHRYVPLNVEWAKMIHTDVKNTLQTPRFIPLFFSISVWVMQARHTLFLILFTGFVLFCGGGSAIKTEHTVFCLVQNLNTSPSLGA